MQASKQAMQARMCKSARVQQATKVKHEKKPNLHTLIGGAGALQVWGPALRLSALAALGPAAQM